MVLFLISYKAVNSDGHQIQDWIKVLTVLWLRVNDTNTPQEIVGIGWR